MIQERPSITIYSNTLDVLGMFTCYGQAIQAGLSTTGTETRYWDDDTKTFQKAEVVWDGALPDQYGGHTKGEILTPWFPEASFQWRLMGAPARSQARFWQRGSDEGGED